MTLPTGVTSPGNTKLVDDNNATLGISGNPLISNAAVGASLAPWSSQPTQTVTAAADTILKFGTAGTTPFTHLSMQNNNTINFIYSIDADSTASGAKVYVLAPGQRVWDDRSGSTIHCHTASSVSFGGDAGITIEAFA